MARTSIDVETPAGPARVRVDAASAAPAAAAPAAGLVLGHGAGGGTDAADLAALAGALPHHGVTVYRVEQPWRVAGRKVAGPPSTLDTAWLAILEALALEGPFVVGGRSAGARVACRTAARVGAAGCLALAFPLHPPGRPERSRLDELVGAGVPTLVIQGERDPFGGPSEFPPAARSGGTYDVRIVPGADHSFRVPKAWPEGSRAGVQRVVAEVAAWLPGRL